MGQGFPHQLPVLENSFLHLHTLHDVIWLTDVIPREAGVKVLVADDVHEVQLGAVVQVELVGATTPVLCLHLVPLAETRTDRVKNYGPGKHARTG